MKNDLNAEQLRQEVNVNLPLSALLRLAELEARLPTPASAPAFADLGFMPAIGADFAGGRYAGLTLHDNRPFALVRLPGEFTGTHADALKWAEEQGGSLPSRFDGLALFNNLKGDFKEEYYWLEPLRAGFPDYAWIQHFGSGYQFWNHRGYHYRACAVRRVAIK